MTDVTMPSTGATATLDHEVTQSDTAETLGSGDLPVLGTPRLLAWIEQATCAAVAQELDTSCTSVGTQVRIQHLQPSPLRARVVVRAELTHVEGRLLSFEVSAEHEDGRVVAHGEVTRAVVDRERFLQRLG